MQPTLKIEAGKFYRTKRGDKAVIYTTNAKGDFCIHGAISNSVTGNDDVARWDTNGMHEWGESALVSEWHETPVAKFWPEFKWQAMDKSETWFAYTHKPEFVKGEWGISDGDCYALTKYQSPTFTGKPEDSLISRDGI